MSTRPETPLFGAPSASILRNRPSASTIDNPISLDDPALPVLPDAARGFIESQMPSNLAAEVAALATSLQTASELAIVEGFVLNGNRGLYKRSSGNIHSLASAAANYVNTMGESLAKINDAARSAELVNTKYDISGFTVDVKRFVAQADGAVDRYEANAEAYVQAQNIIYESDITAIKLQDMGIER